MLNLAAGLDARAWRMPLPPTLRWIDVDLPGILDYKTADAERRKTRLSLRGSPARPARCGEATGAVLADRRTVVARTRRDGGAVIYLTAEQVGALARDLHAAPRFQWWVIDIASPRLLE